MDKTTRDQVLETAKQSGLRIRTYEVRYAGPWSREPPCIVDAHTIDAARSVAEAEKPGCWLGQAVVIS